MATEKRIMIEGNQGLLTETDLSLLFGVPESSIIRRIKNKELPGRKLEGRNRAIISIKELINWAEYKNNKNN